MIDFVVDSAFKIKGSNLNFLKFAY